MKFLQRLVRLSLPIAASTALLAAPTYAAPTVTTYAGNTTVSLSQALLSALASLHVTASREFPAQLSGSTAKFPIPNGQIDLADAHGEITHSGGLNLIAGSTTVTLSDFVIDTTGSQPVLTGLVLANGSVVGRLPLFNLALTQAPQVHNFGFSGTLRIAGVDLTLTATAAGALNQAFNVTAFSAGIPIGTASVDAFTYNPTQIWW
ncbi:hypothetical protein GCM10007862_10220 [Dyella lipolytica]|uniref:Uncharacterized protein n=1 Tax=Dyella lipolytica TaxID=1867835 RepID=A0ABW8IZH9_9GAMM|nr:hypothetical protein [Dyella lipolytica]GLQ45971.1 hypothetical protein GCM10007862_10220 [Dyella lipolytica]